MKYLLVADYIAIDAESGEEAQLPRGVPPPPETSPVVRRIFRMSVVSRSFSVPVFRSFHPVPLSRYPRDARAV